MAKNIVILTAGEAIKREARLMSGTSQPGMFVVPTADADKDILTDKSTGSVIVNADGTSPQIAVVDLTSANGMAWDITYATGDQIPILYPTNGCIINVLTQSDAAIAYGANMTITAGYAAAGDSNVIGVAAESFDPADYPEGTIKKIKVEVLK